MRPKDLVARRVDAFNNSDAAALAAFYAETAIKHQVAQEQVHGRDAIKGNVSAGIHPGGYDLHRGKPFRRRRVGDLWREGSVG